MPTQKIEVEEVKREGRLSGQSFAFFGDFENWPQYLGGSPSAIVWEHGGTVSNKVTKELTYVVFADKSNSKSEKAREQKAREQVENIFSRAVKAKEQGKDLPCPKVIDEAAFKEMIAVDLDGKSIAFCGGFDLCDGDLDESVLYTMVKVVGGNAVKEIDGQLDYLVCGNKKTDKTAQAQAKKLQSEGAKLQTMFEDRFFAFVRAKQPAVSDSEMDFSSFISHLYGCLDTGKLGRALKMLRSESFQLYVRRTDESITGVVSSQTGSGKLYASWLNNKGNYCCATEDLDECMGQQGDICKHLLVLLIGLVRTKQMKELYAFKWIQTGSKQLPRRDSTTRELISQAFLEHKAANAGQIDWRPTETIPEDYYTF